MCVSTSAGESKVAFPTPEGWLTDDRGTTTRCRQRETPPVSVHCLFRAQCCLDLVDRVLQEGGQLLVRGESIRRPGDVK